MATKTKLSGPLQPLNASQLYELLALVDAMEDAYGGAIPATGGGSEFEARWKAKDALRSALFDLTPHSELSFAIDRRQADREREEAKNGG